MFTEGEPLVLGGMDEYRMDRCVSLVHTQQAQIIRNTFCATLSIVYEINKVNSTAEIRTPCQNDMSHW